MSVFFLIPHTDLRGEFVCTGTVCQAYPDLQNDLNGLIDQVENDYLEAILENNTESAFLTNLMANSPGRGHVNRFQIGFTLSAAGVKKDDIQLQTQRVELPNLPNRGVALNPAVNLDFNLGWLMRKPKQSQWSRISVFLHGMDMRFSEGDLQGITAADPKLKLASRVESWGGMIRYQAVQPKSFGGYYFSWHGINLGAGAVYSRQSHRASYLSEKADDLKWNGLEGKWGGDTNFDYRTTARTYNVDLRTGVGVLWIFNLYAGGGYSWNNGESTVSLERTGPYVISTGPIAAIEIPREYQDLFDVDSLQTGGELGLRSNSRGTLRKGFGYAVGGIELDLFAIKAIFEAVYARKELVGGSVGFRIAF